MLKNEVEKNRDITLMIVCWGRGMRKNYNSVLACAFLFAIGGECLADTKIGLGTGVSTTFSGYYGGVISMPIKLDSIMLIEPFAGYSRQSQNADSNLPDYNEYSRQAYQLGVGLYGISKLVPKFEIYYGAAVAAGKSERDSERKYGDNFYKDEYKTTEYMIKPTLGISYLINENFSFSLDAGIYYYWGKEEVNNIQIYGDSPSINENREYTVDTQGVNTFTRFLFRMVF